SRINDLPQSAGMAHVAQAKLRFQIVEKCRLRSCLYVRSDASRLFGIQVPHTPMKIAILGTRGIPARYGGFETLADELSRRLVDRGHEVTVYCRRPFTSPGDEFDPRIHRVILPTVRNKHFDTLVHGFLSTLRVVFTDVDVILICNVANAPYAWV